MDWTAETLRQIGEKASNLPQKQALVGFDGFVDRIFHPVDQRSGPGEQFSRIETIAALGERISAAAGKSTNVEIYPIVEKLGGNGPILARALRTGGVATRFIGAIGEKEIHPLFKDFAANTDAVSVADPGVTHAIEFLDGKVMFGETTSLEKVTYERIIEVMGEGPLIDASSRADLIAINNWTMTPHLNAIARNLVEKVFTNLGPRDQRNFNFDLCDPAKRSDGELSAFLRTLKQFSTHGYVTLGLNLAEAQRVDHVLGNEGVAVPEPDALKQLASRIRRELEINCVVVHPRDGAACADRSDAWYVKGPYCDRPKIETGAGDHFNAGFALGQCMGLSPACCLMAGVATSGYYVRQAESPSLSALDSFIRSW